MIVRPLAVGGTPFCYRTPIAVATPGSYGAGTSNLGITWANASDHTQKFGLPLWDFANGISMAKDDLATDKSAYGGTLNFWAVNAAGVDQYIFITVNLLQVVVDFSLTGVSAANGFRLELVRSGSPPDTLTIPSALTFLLAPNV